MGGPRPQALLCDIMRVDLKIDYDNLFSRSLMTDPELGRPDPTVGASAQSFLLEANDLVRDQEAGFQ